MDVEIFRLGIYNNYDQYAKGSLMDKPDNIQEMDNKTEKWKS